ncbi:MAG: hypothetical protein ACK5LP_03710 [Campylobacteraceae bacterium]
MKKIYLVLLLVFLQILSAKNTSSSLSESILSTFSNKKIDKPFSQQEFILPNDAKLLKEVEITYQDGNGNVIKKIIEINEAIDSKDPLLLVKNSTLDQANSLYTPLIEASLDVAPKLSTLPSITQLKKENATIVITTEQNAAKDLTKNVAPISLPKEENLTIVSSINESISKPIIKVDEKIEVTSQNTTIATKLKDITVAPQKENATIVITTEQNAAKDLTKNVAPISLPKEENLTIATKLKYAKINHEDKNSWESFVTYEVNNKKLKIFTKDSLKEFIDLSHSGRVVLDFQRDKVAIVTQTMDIRDSGFDSISFSSIRFGSDSSFYRVIIKLTGKDNKYVAKRITGGYEITLE